MKLKILVAIVSITIVLSSFSVLATSQNGITYDNQDFNSGDIFVVGHSTSYNSDYTVNFTNANNIYIFLVKNGNYHEYYLASVNQQTVEYNVTWRGNTSAITVTLTSGSDTNGLFVNNFASISYLNTINVPIYGNISDATLELSQYIQDVNSPSGNDFNYSLPAGNFIVVHVDSNFEQAYISTTMPLQSTSFSDNPWPNTTQRYATYSELPENINPNTVGDTISWQRDGNTTLFNITTQAKYVILDLLHQYNYFVVVNPYYYPANDLDDSQYTNGAISIQACGVLSFKVYNMTATVNTSTGTVENNTNGIEWDGTIDPDSGDIIWTNQDNENQAPSQGGNLSTPTITGFQSWLQNAIQSIINIFEPAHQAITTLASAVTNFATWLYALYIWLPSPILTVLTSAITLSIIIGVIKAFM